MDDIWSRKSLPWDIKTTTPWSVCLEQAHYENGRSHLRKWTRLRVELVTGCCAILTYMNFVTQCPASSIIFWLRSALILIHYGQDILGVSHDVTIVLVHHQQLLGEDLLVNHLPLPQLGHHECAH